MRNMVIREVLRLGQDEVPGVGEAEPVSSPQDTLPTSSGTQPGTHNPQPKAAPHQQAQTHRTVSHTDAARCVLQLFRSMGRIFQEQSAADTIQAGLHIDKKRRRMLREKRMALGHRADDHEDAVSINTPK